MMGQYTRLRSQCHTCGGGGAVLWEQKAKLTGLMVLVAYRCHCTAGGNYPTLPPASQPPSGMYEGEA